MGGCHSSLASSVPSILQSRVRIPSTPSTLFTIYIIDVKMRKECKWTKKWPVLAHIKKQFASYTEFLISLVKFKPLLDKLNAEDSPVDLLFYWERKFSNSIGASEIGRHILPYERKTRSTREICHSNSSSCQLSLNLK